MIEYALIEWADTRRERQGVAATIRNNTIRNFIRERRLRQRQPVRTARSIQSNLIDNLNDAAWTASRSTTARPRIQGNTLTNCNVGLACIGGSTTTVIASNIITANNYGLYVSGNNCTAPCRS